MAGPEGTGFWETAEAVERFAARDPDVRLMGLLNRYPVPGDVRVLDLGCAAGRNTAVLAGRGFDVFAVDGSEAMVARTRERVGELLGPEEAERRVLHGAMDDLERFEDGSVALVVALGILHQAGSGREWKRTIEEIGRVLEPGGLLLVAAWSPRSRPDGRPLVEVAGEDHLYEGFHSGFHYLVDRGLLDRAMASAGLLVVEPTEEVEVETGTGSRVTVNGLYQKSGS
jgi:SAM-dependent methyltransferase